MFETFPTAVMDCDYKRRETLFMHTIVRYQFPHPAHKKVKVNVIQLLNTNLKKCFQIKMHMKIGTSLQIE